MNNPTPALKEVRTIRPGLKAALVSPEARYPMLVGSNPREFARLRKLRVAMVGVGSVGMRVALHLARMGVDCLLLVDPKCFKAESLLTHEIGPEEIGKPKALTVGLRCQAISTPTRVLSFVGPVEALEADALAEIDLVVMAPDVISVEVEVAQRCLHLGIPLIHASVHGETLVAQVRLYANANAQGCCAGCFLGREEWKQLSRQVRFSCDGATANSTPREAVATSKDGWPVTASFSNLCSLAADLAVNQLLRFVLQLGGPVADSMLEYCGFTHHMVASKLARNPLCPLDHFTYRRVVLTEPLGRFSLAALAQATTGEVAEESMLFEVTGMDWVEFGRCDCAQMRPVWRFVPSGQSRAIRCTKCGVPVIPLQFYTHRRVSGALLGSALRQPLRKLGAGRVGSVRLRTGETGTLIRHQPPGSSKS